MPLVPDDGVVARFSADFLKNLTAVSQNVESDTSAKKIKS